MTGIIVQIIVAVFFAIFSVQAFAQETVNLLMKSETAIVRVAVTDGDVSRVMVNDAVVPNDRVKLEGKGLVVTDNEGRIVGAMANLSANGKSPLRRKVATTEIPANEIVAKIAAGHEVNYENVTITGDLDLTRLPNQINDSVYPENGKTAKVFTGSINEMVSFKNVIFKGKINLFRADETEKEKFEYRVAFKKDATFENCTFEQTANFELTNFDAAVSIRGSRFIEKPLFIRVGLQQKPALENTVFEKNAVFQFTQNDDAEMVTADQLRTLIAKIF